MSSPSENFHTFSAWSRVTLAPEDVNRGKKNRHRIVIEIRLHILAAETIGYVESAFLATVI